MKDVPPVVFKNDEEFRLYVVQRLAVLETKMSFISYISGAALASVLAVLGAVITVITTGH